MNNNEEKTKIIMYRTTPSIAKQLEDITKSVNFFNNRQHFIRFAIMNYYMYLFKTYGHYTEYINDSEKMKNIRTQILNDSFEPTKEKRTIPILCRWPESFVDDLDTNLKILGIGRLDFIDASIMKELYFMKDYIQYSEKTNPSQQTN